MPSEIKNFQSDINTCSFEIKGMPKIYLKISEKMPFSKISLSASNSPVSFSLNCFITNFENKCQAKLEIHAEINLMMKMMIEKPMKNLLDALSHKLQDI